MTSATFFLNSKSTADLIKKRERIHIVIGNMAFAVQN